MRLLSGQRAWVVQRLTALYILLFVVAGVCGLLIGERPSYDTWRALVAHPAGATGVLLFFAALFVHAWIGLRDIVLDYVHPFALRAALLVAIAAGLLALQIWTVLILAALHGSVGR